MNAMALPIDEAFPERWQSRLLRRGVIAFSVTMSLGIFQYFPGMRPVTDAWTGLCLLSLVTLYPLLKSRLDWTFSKFELYLLAMLPVLIFLPAIGAWMEFGQPVYYGALSQRSALLVANWLIFINAWRLRWLRLKDIEPALLFVVWLTFVILDGLQYGVSPVAFSSLGFTAGEGANETFTTPGSILLFGLLYYALRGVRRRSVKDYLYAILLLSSTLQSSGRALSLGVAITVLFFLFRWQKLRDLVLTLSSATLIVALAVGVLQVVNPDKLRSIEDRYAQAVAAVTGGSSIQDPSSIARVYQTNLALPYVLRHPLIGVGALSAQWHGANAGAFGDYFFPSDLGLIGVMFSYGAVGFLLALMQYYFVLSATFRAPKGAHGALMDCLKGMVLVEAMLSLVTGAFVFTFQVNTFYIMMLILLSNDAAAEHEATEFAQPQLQLVA